VTGTRLRAAVAALGWLAFLGVSLVALHRLGDTMPVVPPEGRSYEDWLAEGGPTVLIVGVGRLAALGVGWYLLVATGLLLSFRLLGWWRAVVAVEAVVPRLVRRVAHGAVGLTLAAAPAPAMAATATGLPAPVVRPVATAEGEADPITMRRLPEADVPAAPTPAPDRPPAPESPRTWTIAPGEHLWSIAQDVVAEHLGRRPTDREIDPYWRTLVEVNRPRLADPSVPDLVFPGQVLEVPRPGPTGV
jgi:nucleoid-associated protein YgaU